MVCKINVFINNFKEKIMNSRNLSIPSIQNWLERLNNVLENYDYDLKTAASEKEMDIFKAIKDFDISKFENLLVFCNYILAIQDIPKPGLCSWSDNMKLANYNTNSIIAEGNFFYFKYWIFLFFEKSKASKIF